MSEKWSDDINIKEIGDISKLAAMLVNQQFDYWYDPCGKSGDEFNEVLTPKSVAILNKMYWLMNDPEKLKNLGHKVS